MIRDFFVGVYPAIKAFGLEHIIISFLFIIGLVLIVINKKKIHNISSKNKRKITIYIISILFLNMTIYYLAKVFYGTFDYINNLPLHFCFISGYLFMYAWLTKNIKLIKLTYFCGFLGPFVAMIWPNPPTYISYTFYQFIISHHFFFLGNLFLYYAYNYQIKKSDYFKVFIVVNIIFLTVGIFNAVFNTNYIMSKSLPEFFLNLYPFFRNYNYTVLWVELGGIVAALIAYIPVYFNKNKKFINVIN